MTMATGYNNHLITPDLEKSMKDSAFVFHGSSSTHPSFYMPIKCQQTWPDQTRSSGVHLQKHTPFDC